MPSIEVFDSSVYPTAARKQNLPAVSSPSAATTTMANNESTSRETPCEINEGVYTQELYMLGHKAMSRIAELDILVSGAGGLGVEIARNFILGGVKSVTLHDNEICTIGDLSNQPYLSGSDVGKKRAEVSYGQLSKLNNDVCTRIYNGSLIEKFIERFDIVVLTNKGHAEQDRIAKIIHANRKALIIGSSYGWFAQIFCDFGEIFTVSDDNKANPISNMVAGITKDLEGVVTCLDGTCHGLDDGQYVTFSEVQGMTELNGHQPIKIKVNGQYKFSIGDTSNFGTYISGGIITQVKMSQITVLTMKSLEEAEKKPNYVIIDLIKKKPPTQLHFTFKALDEFATLNDRLPTIPTSEAMLTVNTAIGNAVTHEVFSASSANTPIRQLLYFDTMIEAEIEFGNFETAVTAQGGDNAHPRFHGLRGQLLKAIRGPFSKSWWLDPITLNWRTKNVRSLATMVFITTVLVIIHWCAMGPKAGLTTAAIIVILLFVILLVRLYLKKE